MRTLISVIKVLALFIASGYALANDSIGRVAAGGVVLLKSEKIRMLEEILEISPKVIRVKYKFRNESSSDIRTTVLFPMPEYGWTAGEYAYEENVRPLRSFKLAVDGVSTPVKLERRAVTSDRDVTAQLRKVGLTDSQIFDTFGDCILNDGDVHCGISGKQQVQISRLLKSDQIYNSWKIAETVYWDQTFPAGRTIEVTHEYPPFVGTRFSAIYQEPSDAKELSTGEWLNSLADRPNEACIDDGVRQAVTRKIRSYVSSGAKTVWVTLNDVEYILGTGRNWKGPISNFVLRIHKASLDQFISVCFPGKPKKINSQLIEFSQSDYIPQDRLVVHFYTVSGEEK